MTTATRAGVRSTAMRAGTEAVMQLPHRIDQSSGFALKHSVSVFVNDEFKLRVVWESDSPVRKGLLHLLWMRLKTFLESLRGPRKRGGLCRLGGFAIPALCMLTSHRCSRDGEVAEQPRFLPERLGRRSVVRRMHMDDGGAPDAAKRRAKNGVSWTTIQAHFGQGSNQSNTFME